MQQLCGHLNFVCQAIVPGRAFLRRLYYSTKGVRKPHHHIKITEALKRDLHFVGKIPPSSCSLQQTVHGF